MSQEPISKKRVLFDLPGMEAVTVHSDIEYGRSGDSVLTMDVYIPSRANARYPAVIIVAGYPDAGFQRIVGCRFKEMGSSVSWGQLIAASGMVAITYTNRDPVVDLDTLTAFVRNHAASLAIDESRIGVWASSGNVPLALSMLMSPSSESIKAAVFFYGLMLDLDGDTGIAENAKVFRFANPCAGTSVENLRQDVPLFLARAGQDQTPHLNQALDRFVSHALKRNLPVTLMNHPSAPHAFDLDDDSETTRRIVRQSLSFLHFHLQGD